MARHEEQWFELSEVVRRLRGQLNQAMADGKDDDIQFELGPVELEFEVVVSKERGADGGLKVGVVSLGAKGARSNGNTNRMKLTLTPQNRQGGPARISGSERTLPQG
ncbi:trypco2 family protein [Streptomyces malaysiensis]|uniref:trypco2 family protein n=1 Tax=Streptomyces malaysiensis TaxID=92644 RepID=UPI002B2B4E14|nr:trypco2 family protein [Streptomyces malaysiensis]